MTAQAQGNKYKHSSIKRRSGALYRPNTLHHICLLYQRNIKHLDDVNVVFSAFIVLSRCGLCGVMVRGIGLQLKTSRFDYWSFRCQVATLGLLYTQMSICHQAVQFCGASHRVAMSSDGIR